MRSRGSFDLIGSTYRFHILVSIFIALAVITVYSNTLGASFHLDDFKQITDNQSLRDLDNFFSILTAPKRGVANATFALNYALGGESVRGYHLVNIAIHILNSIFVYFLLFFTLSSIRKIRERAGRIAIFSALLFAVHPVQTQAVTYITQRQESLSALFCLLALIFLVLALRSRGRVKGVLLYAAVPICYVLAFYSKEISITLPALVLFFDLYFARGFSKSVRRGRWALHGVMGVLLIFFAVTSISALGGFKGLKDSAQPPVNIAVSKKAATKVEAPSVKQVKPSAKVVSKKVSQMATAGFEVQGLSPKQYLMTELNVLTYYMALLAVPIHQNIDYDFPISKSLFGSPELREGTRLIYPIPPPIVSLIIIAAVLVSAFFLLWRDRRASAAEKEDTLETAVSERARGRIASYFILWFFITLSPTSSFIPIIDVIFEHRLYLASLGFFVITVLFVDWLSYTIFGRFSKKDAVGRAGV